MRYVDLTGHVMAVPRGGGGATTTAVTTTSDERICQQGEGRDGVQQDISSPITLEQIDAWLATLVLGLRWSIQGSSQLGSGRRRSLRLAARHLPPRPWRSSRQAWQMQPWKQRSTTSRLGRLRHPKKRMRISSKALVCTRRKKRSRLSGVGVKGVVSARPDPIYRAERGRRDKCPDSARRVSASLGRRP